MPLGDHCFETAEDIMPNFESATISSQKLAGLAPDGP